MTEQRISVLQTWKIFTKEEKWNIACHTIALTFYKFGLEAYGGSVIALATNRYDYEAAQAAQSAKTFQRIGAIGALGQTAFVIGANLAGPLLPRWPLKRLLLAAIFVVMLSSTLLLIIDAATGGHIKPKAWHEQHDFAYYGHYNTDIMLPVSFFRGLATGITATNLKILPQRIVGTDEQKLRRMGALVHLFNQVASTAGAFMTAIVLIPHLGTNYAFIITPFCVLIAGCTWACMSNLSPSRTAPIDREEKEKQAGLKTTIKRFVLFPKSFFLGAKIIFSSRSFVWLLPANCVNRYGHVYLEGSIAPVIARRYLGVAEWAQIMVGGSNLGELLGALFVLFFTNLVHTPLPWLRLDALMFLAVWYLPFWYPRREDVHCAWIVAATFMPLSLGWAAGDISLFAYLQANLGSKEDEQQDAISHLGAVIGCMSTVWIIIFAILNPFLGRYIDTVYAESGGINGGTVRPAIFNVAGVQYTVLMAVGMASTFLPRGAFKLNPKTLRGEEPENREENDLSRASGPTTSKKSESGGCEV